MNAWVGPTSAPPEPQEAQLLEWELLLPGGAALERAVENLAAHAQRLQQAADGDAVLTDAWGNRLRLAAYSA